MSKLTQWLDHRMEVVGLENRKDLSEYSGVSEDALEDMNTVGSLTLLSRSERRWLAAALRVSLRKLEQLDSGEIESIRDDHVVDVDVRGRPLPRHEDDPAYWTPKEVKPEDRGTPLVGRIRSNGTAEADEDWQEEWGRRVPARFGKGFDIYAMEIEGTQQCVVFHNIPAWEFREGEAALSPPRAELLGCPSSSRATEHGGAHRSHAPQRPPQSSRRSHQGAGSGGR